MAIMINVVELEWHFVVDDSCLQIVVDKEDGVVPTVTYVDDSDSEFYGDLIIEDEFWKYYLKVDGSVERVNREIL